MLKGILFYKLENATISMGPAFRALGQQLFRQGMSLQGASAHEDTLVPSLRCVPISSTKFPKLLEVSTRQHYNCVFNINLTPYFLG
jgi:hypothetical protein